MINALLTSFRSEIPLPDEATAQRIYARATSARRRLPQRKVVLAAAVVVATAAAVLIGFFAVPGSSPQHPAITTGQVLGHFPVNAFTVTYNRSGGILNSVDLTVNPSMPDARIFLQVLHTDQTTTAGTDPSSTVVFTEIVSATNTSGAAAADGPSTWSGTLYPSDWSGGCQSGLYEIVTYSGGPGAVITRPNIPGDPHPTPPVDGYQSGWFRCSSA